MAKKKRPVRKPQSKPDAALVTVLPATTVELLDDDAFAQHRADVARELAAAAASSGLAAERLAAARERAAAAHAEMRECASELRRAEWSLRRIGQVAGVSHTEVARWLAAETEVGSPHDLEP